MGLETVCLIQYEPSLEAKILPISESAGEEVFRLALAIHWAKIDGSTGNLIPIRQLTDSRTGACSALDKGSKKSIDNLPDICF